MAGSSIPVVGALDLQQAADAPSGVGAAFWPEGRCVAELTGFDGGGIMAIGCPGGLGQLVSASANGVLGCWDDCARLVSVGKGRGVVTCFACLYPGQRNGGWVWARGRPCVGGLRLARPMRPPSRPAPTDAGTLRSAVVAGSRDGAILI